MIPLTECDSFPAGRELDVSICEWLSLMQWGVVPLRPSRSARDAFVCAERFCCPTSHATRFTDGLTLHLQFDPPRHLARASFADNATGNTLATAISDIPELAIARLLLKMKHGHYDVPCGRV